MQFIKTLVITTALILSGALPAQAADDIKIEKAWARETGARTGSTAAYLTLHNTGDKTVTLTGASADFAAMVMIHNTIVDDSGKATMRHAKEIAIAPGAKVELAPRGTHIMLMRLKESLKRGEMRGITLHFKDHADIAVQAKVMPITGAVWDHMDHSKH